MDRSDAQALLEGEQNINMEALVRLNVIGAALQAEDEAARVRLEGSALHAIFEQWRKQDEATTRQVENTLRMLDQIKVEEPSHFWNLPTIPQQRRGELGMLPPVRHAPRSLTINITICNQEDE